MTMKKYRWLIWFLLFNTIIPLNAATNFKWQIGEELVFKVRWSFLRLGTLKMQVVDTARIKGHLLHRVKLQMDSNPVLIFVNLHNQYECLIDSLFRPVIYVVNEKNGDHENIMMYQFDYDKNKVFWDIMEPDDSVKILEHKVLDLDHYMYDGISLTFFARGNAEKGASFKVYSFIRERKGPVDIYFSPKIQDIYFSRANKHFETYMVSGIFHLKGIAGVTGKYKGWFTNDKRRIPLKALMKVFVGNVVVELEKWQKWSP